MGKVSYENGLDDVGCIVLNFSAALLHSGTTIWESESCAICREFTVTPGHFLGKLLLILAGLSILTVAFSAHFTVRGTVSEMKTPGLWCGFHRNPKVPACPFLAER
jgi:hypothetical protein